MSLKSSTMKVAKVRWDATYKELREINETIAKLARRKRQITKELQSISEVHTLLGGKALRLTPEQQIFLKETPSLGDIIEAMLK